MKSSFVSLAIAFAVLPACLPEAESPPDETGTESDGLSICRKGACGPALGMPTILCSDGSTGGNTGRCIRERGSACHWEVRACPAPDCAAPGACGPALGMPNKLCSDGKTVSGPTGRCLDKGGVCGWEVISCPATGPSCSAPGACGPALGMPNYLCPDGKTVAGPGACIDKGGTCGWDIVSCP
jgi:hypothetical protein